MSFVPVGFASIFVGGVLGIAGVTGSSIHSVVQGKPDKLNSGSPTTETGGTTSHHGGGTGWRAEMASISQRKGWSLSDWMWIISKESGGNPKATNESSGAFGLGQFLPSNRSAYPGAFSSNPAEQIREDARYIQERYGNPTAARKFHEENGWY